MLVLTADTPRTLDLLAVSPNGHVAAGGSGLGVPGEVNVWDIRSGDTATASFGRLTALAFTPTGRHLLAGNDSSGLAVLDPLTGGTRAGPRGWMQQPRFGTSPGGRHLLAANGSRGVGVGWWAADDGPEYVRRIWWVNVPLGVQLHAPAVAPHGTRGAVVERFNDDREHPRQAIQVRDPWTGGVRVSIPCDPADPVEQLAFTAAGRRLVVRTRSRVVKLFDADTGRAAGELVGKGRAFVTGVAVSPAGPIATSRTDGTVTVWDPDTLRVVTRYDWQLGRLASVAFSPDGTLAAAGTEDGRVVVWDVDT